jgi:hypothetical protein
VNICAWPWNGNIGKGSLPELKKKLIEGGTDVRLFGSNPKMLLMHNDWMGQHIKENELEFVEKYNRNKKIWDYVTQEKPCAVFFWTGFYEMRLFLPEDMLNPYWAAKNWLIVNSEKRFIGSAGKSARDYLSAFSNAFAYADPIFFSNRFTDVAEHRGFLIQRAEAGQTMSYIPKGIYRTMKGSNKNIVLKRRGNNAYIVNNTPESPEVKLMATGSEPFIFNSINNINLGIDKHSILKIKMKPYQILPLSLRNVNSMKILKN